MFSASFTRISQFVQDTKEELAVSTEVIRFTWPSPIIYTTLGI